MLVVAAVTFIIILIIFFMYKQLLFTTFNAEVAQVYGVKTAWVDTLFSLALAAALIASMQILGVTLIAAALVIPAIASRLLTDSFNRMIVLSTLIGMITNLIWHVFELLHRRCFGCDYCTGTGNSLWVIARG